MADAEIKEFQSGTVLCQICFLSQRGGGSNESTNGIQEHAG